MVRALRNLALAVVSTAICLATIEVVIRISGLPYSEPFPDASVFNPEIAAALDELVRERVDQRDSYAIGWDGRVGRKADRHIAGLHYEVNENGIRGAETYLERPEPHVARIAAFGDSFIFGQCLPDDRYWVPQLVARLGNQVEVLNFGVNGFGTDQALVKYRRTGRRFHPDVVIIGVYAQNFLRNVNMFRYLYTDYRTDRPVPKPRFLLEDGNLKLIPPMPVSELRATLSNFDKFELKHAEYFFDKTFLDRFPFNQSRLFEVVAYRWRQHKRTLEHALSPGSEPFETTLAIVRRFYEDVRNDGATSFVLLIPHRSLAPFDDFERALEKERIPYLNLLRGLVRHMKRDGKKWADLTVPDCYHFNEEGSRIMADEIFHFLTTNDAISLKPTARSAQIGDVH